MAGRKYATDTGVQHKAVSGLKVLHNDFFLGAQTPVATMWKSVVHQSILMCNTCMYENKFLHTVMFVTVFFKYPHFHISLHDDSEADIPFSQRRL